MKFSNKYVKILLGVMVVLFLFVPFMCRRPDVEALKMDQDITKLIRILGWIEGEDARDALIEIGLPAVDPLIEALRKNNADVAGFSAYALGQIGDSRAIEPLISALEHKQPSVGKASAAALAEFGDSHSIDAVIDKIRRIPDETPPRYKDNVSAHAYPYFQALAEFGFPGLEALNNARDELDDVFLNQASESVAGIIL